MVSKNVVTGKLRIHTGVKSKPEKKNHLVIKVQKTLDKDMNELCERFNFQKMDRFSTALTVSSQKEDVYGFIMSSDPEYPRVLEMIEKEGLMGYKIFLNSYIQDDKLMVNTARILAPKSW